MAGDALFIGWGKVVPGREKVAFQVFQESTEMYGRLEQDGRIDSFESMLLSPHGGDLAGFVILRGQRQALSEIQFGEEFTRLVARATALVDSLGVIPAYGGEELAMRMGLFQEAAAELGS
jgi:hypothetical protein